MPSSTQQEFKANGSRAGDIRPQRVAHGEHAVGRHTPASQASGRRSPRPACRAGELAAHGGIGGGQGPGT